MTLHPASQNFFVEIREECCSPGTMWASVISSGSHGIPKLHVCVEYMMLPSGSFIAIGNSAAFMLTTAEPSTRKCDDAPESESTYSTNRTRRLVLNIICELGDWVRSLSLTIFIHNSCLDLARGLLASLCSLRFALFSTHRFHFLAVLLVSVIPNGSASLGIDIVDENVCCSGGMSTFVAVALSVPGWVSLVAASFL